MIGIYSYLPIVKRKLIFFGARTICNQNFRYLPPMIHRKNFYVPGSCLIVEPDDCFSGNVRLRALDKCVCGLEPVSIFTTSQWSISFHGSVQIGNRVAGLRPSTVTVGAWAGVRYVKDRFFANTSYVSSLTWKPAFTARRILFLIILPDHLAIELITGATDFKYQLQ